MKKMKFLLVLWMIMLSIGFSPNVQAQDPPPPPSQHGSGQDEIPGGGTPIGSGLVTLLITAAAYAGRKYYTSRK